MPAEYAVGSVNTPPDKPVLKLTIIGKGLEVEKMQKRLRCAARATGDELQLSWQHLNPQELSIGASHSVAISNNGKLLLDGLKPTETIEGLLKQLQQA